ncbi:CHAT domain-containing protein [Nonomuraea sp. NPDC049028]|uniref:CHAT domain-containing protein n=1 Tax=Nonomuraea sp. NPDC049028 TaxID=3364348 RepID=UPI0037173C7A
MTELLTLSVTEYTSPTLWRWELTGPEGEFLADHEVHLDESSAEYDAFVDLDAHLRWAASPDRRLVHEGEILQKMGRWLGAHVFGPHIGSALLRYAPASIRVVMPEAARVIAAYPLESTIFADKPLTLEGISLVFEVDSSVSAARRPRSKQPVSDKMRMLCLFSLPEDVSALNLRHERHALARQFQRRIANGQAVELRVLQYGTTRERLTEILEEAEGWDVIHISGHGDRGALVLEHPSGTHDLVSNEQLAELLRPAVRRLKLVTLAACHSAARTAVDSRKLLGLYPPSDVTDLPKRSKRDSMLALTLAQQLDCAVVGMRFPVVDSFAIGLSERLYEYLFDKRHTLPRALNLAVKAVSAGAPALDCPALSASTPAIFGPSALDLKISTPQGSPRSFHSATKMAGFGQHLQPERFVGRVGVMTRAGAALAPESNLSGVWLHGMAGIGKTSCALELAYLHQDSFQELVWYQAPAEGADVSRSLHDLAVALARQLPRVPALEAMLGDAIEFERFLPQLTAFLRSERVLIVLDNLESLLTSKGNWRDPRWGHLIRAMTDHSGLSKIVIASRKQTVDQYETVRVEAIHALSLDETLLLARELPHLRGLIDGTEILLPRDAGRSLAVRILAMTQGHPKLLELADAQAGSPDSDALSQLLDLSDAAWGRGDTLRGFFVDGHSSAGDADFLDILESWTKAVLQQLPSPVRTLFQVLSCLNQSDRLLPVVKAVMQAGTSGKGPEAPLIHHAATVLSDNALISITQAERGQHRYGIHPQIAMTGRLLADRELSMFVDQAAGAFWHGHFFEILGSRANTESLLVAAESAVPYLLRTDQWDLTIPLLETILEYDQSRSTAVRLLPALREMTEKAKATKRFHAGVLLAYALSRVDPPAAEEHTRGLYQLAVQQKEYQQASVLADALIALLRNNGERLNEALILADEMIEHSARALLGPWSRLMDECTRLELKNRIDTNPSILQKALKLRERAKELPVESANEAVRPTQVMETISKIGFNAALATRDWPHAHVFHEELITIMQARGASEQELARARFPGSEILLALDRLDEAREIVTASQRFFEIDGDATMIGACRMALGQIEARAGNSHQAQELIRDGLRYAHLEQKVNLIAAGHIELAKMLLGTTERSEGLLHATISCLIDHLTKSGRTHHSRLVLAHYLVDTDLPPLVELYEQCEVLSERSGLRLAQVLSQHGRSWDQALEQLPDVILAAKIDCARLHFNVHPHLAMWDPLLAGINLGSSGNMAITEEVRRLLSEYGEKPHWTDLVPVLRPLLNGTFDTPAACALHPVQAAIAARGFAFTRVYDQSEIRMQQGLWQARNLSPLFFHVVAAARGDLESTRIAAQNLEQLPKEPHWILLIRGLRNIMVRDFVNVLTRQGGDIELILRTILEHATAPTAEELLDPTQPSAINI